VGAECVERGARGASGGVAGDEQERTGTMSAHVEVLKNWASFTAYAENLDVGSTFSARARLVGPARGRDARYRITRYRRRQDGGDARSRRR